ncbi:hypothetical protein IAR55_005652 [Kwoniella newhampshirensis]|uniref:Uncharacterized protein n=1 Tax=Kwoniella newhampshirensis TaxID=1651941 RepID=A0AAW0YUP2_9TREE
MSQPFSSTRPLTPTQPPFQLSLGPSPKVRKPRQPKNPNAAQQDGQSEPQTSFSEESDTVIPEHKKYPKRRSEPWKLYDLMAETLPGNRATGAAVFVPGQNTASGRTGDKHGLDDDEASMYGLDRSIRNVRALCRIVFPPKTDSPSCHRNRAPLMSSPPASIPRL